MIEKIKKDVKDYSDKLTCDKIKVINQGEDMNKRGIFITFEGTDGCGKSTQIQKIFTYLKEKNIKAILTREPGGTPLSEELRKILLSKEYGKVNPIIELLLMTAARAEHIEKVIEPALNQGVWVICDRFSDATIAYQGYGEYVDLKLIKDILEKSKCSLKPDLTFFIDIDVQKGLDRVPGIKDRFESKGIEFLNRVRQGYLAIAAKEPKRVKVLDGTKNIEEIYKKICEFISL